MNIARTAVKGAAASWGGALAGFGLRFFLNVWLARLIAPSTYGLFAVALVYTELLSIMLAASFAQAIVQSREPSVHRAAVVLRLNFILALAMITVSAGIWPIVLGTDGPVVARFTLALGCARAAGVVVGTYESILQREMSFVALALLRVAGAGLAAVGALTFALLGWPLLALFVRDAAPVVATGMAMFASSQIPWKLAFRPKIIVEQQRLVLGIGKSLFFVRAMEILYYRFDQFVLSRILGASDFAAYAQATYLAGLPNAAVAPATQSVALKVLVEVADNPRRFRLTGEILQGVLVHPLALVSIIMVLAPSSLVSLILGPQWDHVAPILPWLATWVTVVPLSQNTKTMLMALGRWPRLRSTSLVQLSSMVVCGPPMIFWFHSQGAAAALSVSVIATMWWMRGGLQKTEQPRPRVYRGVLSGAAAVFVWWLVSNRVLKTEELVTCGVGILVYTFAVILVDRRLFRQVLSMVMSRLRPP